jgi:hypothetical protein
MKTLGTSNQCFTGICIHRTRLNKFCLHKITVGHELKQQHYTARIHSCDWLLQNVHNRVVDPQMLLINNEAQFYLSTVCLLASVNMQYVQMWSRQILIPYNMCQCSVNVKVLCAPNKWQGTGPTFFSENYEFRTVMVKKVKLPLCLTN